MSRIIQLYIEVKDDSHESLLFHLLHDNNFSIYVAPRQDLLPSTLEEIESILECK